MMLCIKELFMADDCLFCKICAGDIPAKKVYEDDKVIAFADISPQAPHHYLIIPVKHIATTLDLAPTDNELVGHIYQVAAHIAEDKGFAEEGFRVVNNCNEGAGQTVWHLHFHLLGGRELGWPPG
ncbi:histidine triad nucleotide-binding protein [Verrucomicrobia bacterium]|nr:histidine triad nucleotide-binding protein [Verrucomicrobiota bacterium]